LNVNIKSEAQQKKLKTIRGSYTDLDLSIHAKKGPKKSRDTLPLSHFGRIEVQSFQKVVMSCNIKKLDRGIKRPTIYANFKIIE
jgi:hypothetical protein